MTHLHRIVDTTYDKPMKVGITLPGSLIKHTGKTRGDVPRSTYIRRAIEKVSAHTLIIADSKSMSEIKSESIHFVVTSPPYWNLKKYGEEGLGLNQAYAKYLYEIQSVLKEVKRVLASGRFVAINVGTAVSNDGMKPINADVLRMMEDLNFIFKKEIIWVKPKGTQGLWQRGVTKFLKREPYPCYFSLNIMHEYILIFQNEGQMQIPLEKLSEDFIKKVSWSVWEMGVSYNYQRASRTISR